MTSTAALQDMAPPDVTVPYRVIDRVRETHDVTTLRVRPLDGAPPEFLPAQFSMIGLAGIGDVPVSISSPTSETEAHAYTIRAAGAITHRLCAAEVGDVVTIRGPLGQPWDLDGAVGQHLVFIAGGIGIAPLRAAIEHAMAHAEHYSGVSVLVGAKRPEDMVFRTWLEQLREERNDVRLTVDREDPGGSGSGGAMPGVRRNYRIGLVTDLISSVVDSRDTTAYICGPDAMMAAAIDESTRCGLPADRIQVTLERNMHCGHGTCGHCQLGRLIVCRDGPVVTADRLGNALRIREL